MAEKIDALLRDPEQCEQAERFFADKMSFEIARMFRREPVQAKSHTKKNFEKLYDDKLPTIAFDDTHTFAGVELLGVANSRRQADDRRFNVIYLDPAVADIRTTKTGASARRGMIISSTGRVHYGAFPQDVYFDTYETVDTEHLEILRDLGIFTLSDAELMDERNDKAKMGELGETVGIRVPKRYDINELDSNSDIIIKPSRESQGRGVFFGSRYPGDVEQWKKYYDFLEKHNYAPIIEERVHPWPFRDPKTGEMLDWNVRAIISNGELIDMYIRFAKMDTAVNKTNGASTLHIDDLGEYIVDADPSVVRRALENAAKDYAKNSTEFISGIDVTISRDGEVVMFESNAGHVGGLQTMAKLAENKSLHRRLANANKILDLISLDFGSTAKHDCSNEREVPLSVGAKAEFLASLGRLSLLGYELEETSDNGARNTMLAVLVSSLSKKMFSPREEKSHILSRIIADFPLELEPYLEDIHELNFEEMAPHIDEWLAADPEFVSWQYIKGRIAVERDELITAAKSFRELVDLGEEGRATALVASVVLRAINSVNMYIKNEGENSRIPRELSVVTQLLLLCDSKDEFDMVLDAFVAGKDDQPNTQKRRLLIATNLALSFDQYELAQRYLAGLDEAMGESSEVVSDFVYEHCNRDFTRLVRTKEGADFLISMVKKYGNHASAIANIFMRDTKTPIDIEIGSLIISEVTPDYGGKTAEGTYLYSAEDRSYFSEVLLKVFRNEPLAIPVPDPESSALRLLADMYSLPFEEKYGRLFKVLASMILLKDYNLSMDVDMLIDEFRGRLPQER